MIEVKQKRIKRRSQAQAKRHEIKNHETTETSWITKKELNHQENNEIDEERYQSKLKQAHRPETEI